MEDREFILSAVTKLLDERDLRYKERHDAQQNAISAALAAAEKAVTKAEVAAEKRFDGVNEFRGQLKDQSATFITRTEVYWIIGAATGFVGLAIAIFVRH